MIPEKFPIKNLIFLLLLIILSFLPRIALVSKGPYHQDCLTFALRAQQTAETGQLHLLIGHGYPLTAVLGAAAVTVAKFCNQSDPVLAVNYMSVFFGALCIPLFYFFVKKITDQPTAFFSSILLAFNPTFFGISVYGNSHAPSLFFILWGLTFGVRYKERNYCQDLIIAGLLFGLAAGCRLQDVILILPALAFSLFNRTQLKNFVFFFTPFLAMTIILYTPVIQHISGGSPDNIDYLLRGGSLDFYVKLSWAIVSLCFQYFVINFTTLGLIALILGLLIILKRNPGTGIFLCLWALIPIIFFGRFSFAEPRYFLISLLPLQIGLATIFAVMTKAFKKTPSIPYIIFLFFILIIFSRIYPLVEFRHHNALCPEFARWAGEHTEKNAKIITGDEGDFIRHYGHRETLWRPFYNGGLAKNNFTGYKSQLDDYLHKKTPIYITSIGLYSYDFSGNFSNFMREHYELKLIGGKYTEDWHPGEIFSNILIETLYQVLPGKSLAGTAP